MSSVAYAVIRRDSPDVLVADDVEVLHRVLAMQLVAKTKSTDLSVDTRDALRSALLDERWGDAVVLWMERTGVVIDVYTHTHVYEERDVPFDLVGAQLQFTPLFRD